MFAFVCVGMLMSNSLLKVGQLEGELQRLERKKQRDLGGASKGLTAGRRDTEVDQLAKQLEKVIIYTLSLLTVLYLCCLLAELLNL